MVYSVACSHNAALYAELDKLALYQTYLHKADGVRMNFYGHNLAKAYNILKYTKIKVASISVEEKDDNGVACSGFLFVRVK